MSYRVVLAREALASFSGVITSWHETMKPLPPLMAVVYMPLEVSLGSESFGTIWKGALVLLGMVALMMPRKG